MCSSDLVELVGLAAELRAPFGDGEGEHHVQRQRHDGDAGKPDVELDRQDGQHQKHLDQRRHRANAHQSGRLNRDRSAPVL